MGLNHRRIMCASVVDGLGVEILNLSESFGTGKSACQKIFEEQIARISDDDSRSSHGVHNFRACNSHKIKSTMMRSEESSITEEEEEEEQQHHHVVASKAGESIHCNSCPNETSQPLTVFAKHSIIPGKEKEFEAWVKEMIVVQKHSPGYLSSELIRPAVSEQEYISIFRYDSYRNLQKWMACKERDEMIEKTSAFSSKPLIISFHSLEYLFVSEQGRIPPARWKSAIITFLVIFAQLQFLPTLVGYIPNLPVKLAEAITTAIIVILATYVLLPITTRLFAFWLFPDEDYWSQFNCLKRGIREKDIESGD